jgi:selenocysteine lyase/cysteine desulfurase
VRAEIPGLSRAIALNNCSQGPQSTRVREAAMQFLDSWAEAGMEWERWVEEVEAARSSFAGLIGADPASVAVFSSVSHASSALASALDFGGDRKRVVVSESEFPAVGQVWAAQGVRGAEIVRPPATSDPVSGIAEAIDERTLLVSAAHGDYATGARLPLEEVVPLVREQGATLFVDAYQTLGTGPMDVSALDLDFVASGTLKYLMGTAGIAFLYVRPELAHTLQPTVTGWFGRTNPFAFDPWTLDWAPGARRFDGGTPPLLPAYIARAGMDWIGEIGLDAIGEWVGVVAARLIEAGLARGFELLGPSDPAARTPVAAFRSPTDSAATERWLRTRGILTSARGEAIRLAPHFFTTLDEVDSAIDALGEAFDTLPRQSMP